MEDCLYNFRDLAKNVSTILPGRVFRSPALSYLSHDIEKIQNILNKHNITTIIDLRAIDKGGVEQCNIKIRKEDGHDNPEKLLVNRNYIIADFDPWHQPLSFINSKHYVGSNNEIAYRFFILCCTRQINIVMKAILNAEGAVLIHCLSGKDRTGIVSALIGLLSGADKEEIIHDYLESKQDTTIELINIVFDLISSYGGIVQYLNNCGLNSDDIKRLKIKLNKG